MARVLLLSLYKPLKHYQISPPLGLCYLSSSLKAAGHEVLLVDLRAKRRSFREFRDRAAEFAPDVVGISSLVLEHVQLQETAAEIKRLHPGARVVVGGPFANSLPERLLEYPDVDLVVQGEGERIFTEIADRVGRGSADFGLPGVGRREIGGPRFVEGRLVIEDLDALPFPDWRALDLADYHDQPRHGLLYARREYMSIVTSRGCPYHCVFCHNIMGKRFRVRSAANIVDEIETLAREHGIREITISDDVFNLDKERAKEVCDRILAKRLNLKFTFPSGLRGDVMDEDLLRRLQAIGTYKVAYGIETGSPRVQKLIRKNVDLERLREVIRTTSRLGIIVQGFFLFGFPTETREDLDRTVRYALTTRLDLASFNIVTAFPGTELHAMATKMGLALDYTLDQYDYDTIDFQLSDAPTDELRRLIRRLNYRFYLNPLRLARIFRRLPRKRHVFSLAALFVRKVFLWLRA